jgi:hypothetical protein
MASVKEYFNDLGYTDISDLMMLHIANGIAYYRNIEKDIDELYESRKYEFYKMAKESPVYNHFAITQLNLHEEIYTKKMLGVLLLAEEDNDIQQQVMQTIKKANKRMFAGIKSNGYMGYMAEIITDNFDFSLIHSGTFVGIYLLLTIKGKDIINEREKQLIKGVLEEYREKQIIGNSESMLIDIEKGIQDNKQFLKILKERITEDKGSYLDYHDVTLSTNENIKKTDSIVALLFELENLSSSNIMGQVKLTDNDIQQILMSYKILYNDKNLERSTNVLIYGIIIKSLIKAYKNVKDIYFKNNKETLFLDLEYLEGKLKKSEEKEKLLEEKLKILANENDKLKNNLDRQIKNVEKNFNNETISIRKELCDYKGKYDTELKNRNELNELRELMFLIRKEYIPEKLEVNINDLTKHKKIAVIGGSNEWKMRITEKYSNITGIDGFNEGFDQNILSTIDFVFFYTGYMNHGTYYKAINFMRNKEIPFGYIGKTNIDLVEREMVDVLKKHGF